MFVFKSLNAKQFYGAQIQIKKKKRNKTQEQNLIF